jgi:hypothetical protein
MTTQRQINANRENAQHSTGPRTPHGKGVASRNNTQHGLYSSSPVIPRLESPQEWAAHHRATLQSLAPNGPIEYALAERIALILWRLRRVAHYEHTVTTLAQQQAADDLAAEHDDPDTDIQAVRDTYALVRRAQRAIDYYRQSEPEDPITGLQAHLILTFVAAKLPGFDLATFSAPGLLTPRQDIQNTPGWTVGHLQDIIDAIARATQAQADQIVRAARQAVQIATIQARSDYEALTRRVKRLRSERIVPQDTRLESIIRFETHLSRQLTQTLSQLQQLQHRRPTAHPTEAPATTLPPDPGDSNPIAFPTPPGRQATSRRPARPSIQRGTP